MAAYSLARTENGGCTPCVILEYVIVVDATGTSTGVYNTDMWVIEKVE